jgi:hypothetical protein
VTEDEPFSRQFRSWPYWTAISLILAIAALAVIFLPHAH